MRPTVARALGACSAAVIALSLAACVASAAPARTDQVALLSITDLKGKYKPCGCHVPRGGFSRLVSFRDSTVLTIGPTAIVQNGGWLPTDDDERDVALFVMDAFRRMDVAAVGLSETELHFGRAFLLVNGAREKLPLTSANVLDKATGKPLVAPWTIRDVGKARVGFFAVTEPGQDLGTQADSVTIGDPTEAAKQAVAGLRAQGATVIVLLSSLTRMHSEDLVNEVEGIDVAVFGRNATTQFKGRTIGNTIASLSGEQGQYVGRTTLTLDATGHVTDKDNTSVMLSAEVGESAPYLKRTEAFTTAHTKLLAKLHPDRVTPAVAPQDSVSASPWR